MVCENEDYNISCGLFRCYKQFGNRLKSQPTGVTEEIVQVQKTVFLGMTTILRNVLKISAKLKLVNIQTNDW